jgi:hypothetical protein
MTNIYVQLVNPNDADVQVGAGSSLVVAKAHAITRTTVDTRGFAPWHLLAAGVALVPDGVPLARLWAEQPTQEHDALAPDDEHEDETPVEPAPRHRRSTASRANK